MNEMYCLKCEGEMVGCYVDEVMKGTIVKNPEGDKLFSNKKNTLVNPWVCVECGYVEWYAAHPQDLK